MWGDSWWSRARSITHREVRLLKAMFKEKCPGCRFFWWLWPPPIAGFPKGEGVPVHAIRFSTEHKNFCFWKIRVFSKGWFKLMVKIPDIACRDGSWITWWLCHGYVFVIFCLRVSDRLYWRCTLPVIRNDVMKRKFQEIWHCECHLIPRGSMVLEYLLTLTPRCNFPNNPN